MGSDETHISGWRVIHLIKPFISTDILFLNDRFLETECCMFVGITFQECMMTMCHVNKLFWVFESSRLTAFFEIGFWQLWQRLAVTLCLSLRLTLTLMWIFRSSNQEWWNAFRINGRLILYLMGFFYQLFCRNTFFANKFITNVYFSPNKASAFKKNQ